MLTQIFGSTEKTLRALGVTTLVMISRLLQKNKVSIKGIGMLLYLQGNICINLLLGHRYQPNSRLQWEDPLVPSRSTFMCEGGTGQDLWSAGQEGNDDQPWKSKVFSTTWKPELDTSWFWMQVSIDSACRLLGSSYYVHLCNVVHIHSLWRSLSMKVEGPTLLFRVNKSSLKPSNIPKSPLNKRHLRIFTNSLTHRDHDGKKVLH